MKFKPLALLLLIAFAFFLLWNIGKILSDKEYFSFLIFNFLIIPSLLLIIIILQDRKIQYLKHFIGYPTLFFSYSIYIILYIFGISSEFSKGDISKLFHSTMYRLYEDIVNYSYYFSFPFITLLCNIILAWFESKKLTNHHRWILFFSSLFVPVFTFILSILISQVLNIVSNRFLVSLSENLNPVNWFMNGSLIFSLIIYEGLFYLWLKGKVHIID